MEQCDDFKDNLWKYEQVKILKIWEKLIIKFYKSPPENDCGRKQRSKANFVNICNNYLGGYFNGNALVELKDGKKRWKI